LLNKTFLHRYGAGKRYLAPNIVQKSWHGSCINDIEVKNCIERYLRVIVWSLFRCKAASLNGYPLKNLLNRIARVPALFVQSVWSESDRPFSRKVTRRDKSPGDLSGNCAQIISCPVSECN